MFSRALAGTGVAIFSISLEGGRGILGRTLRSRRGTLRLPRVPTGVTWTLSAGLGALLALQEGDLGHRLVTLVPPVGWAEGPTGPSPDDWYQCSTPHGSPPIYSFAPPASREFAGHPLACNPCLPFSSRPLYESSRLADPYTPVCEGVLLDFDPPPKFCATPGSGRRPPSGGHYLSSRTPISGHVRFCLPPSSEGELLTPTPHRVQVGRSQLVSDMQNRPPMSSNPAPVVHGHELNAQDLDLLGYPCGPPTPWDSPPPSSGG